MTEVYVTQNDVQVNVTDAVVQVLPYGGNGWTPVFAVVSDGDRRVLQVVDWIGGSTPNKPATGQYVGPSGFVPTAAEATNISGGGGGSLPVDITNVQDGEILTYDFSNSVWVNDPMVDGGNF